MYLGPYIFARWVEGWTERKNKEISNKKTPSSLMQINTHKKIEVELR